MFDWLQWLVDRLVFTAAGLDRDSHLGAAINFFVFDSIKILLLLFLISTLMGFINSYIPVDRVRNFLSRNKLYRLEYLFASAFGVITPFCSCSAVPLFIGFVKGGIPMGVTLTYLITAPLVNEVAIAMFLGAFGAKITAIYVVTGILLGILGGFVLGKFRLEGYLMPWVQQVIANARGEEEMDLEVLPFSRRLQRIVKESTTTVRGIILYVLLGIGIGAAMHGFLPTGFFEQYVNKEQWYAVPVAVIVGVPMYANAAGVIPVIQTLVAKGIPLGTAIAFMMSVIGLSLPEAMLLKKIMSWRLIGIYFGTIGVFMVLSGYLFNYLF
ncbi:MAG: permease [Spirochaetia bacterium]|nr:permease [Spirochaetia bacterium]